MRECQRIEGSKRYSSWEGVRGEEERREGRRPSLGLLPAEGVEMV
jgi:hypothetical protein